VSIFAIHIHGYNVEDYRQTIGKLEREFRKMGIESSVLVYHADTIRETRIKNPDVARRLAEAILRHQADGDAVIVTAHSNGATILRLAWENYLASPEVAICIQPALPSNTHPSPNADVVKVLWNPSDLVVKHGRFLTWVIRHVIPRWVKDRDWGEMGATGYTGVSPDIINENTMDYPVPASGHSGIFRGDAALVNLPMIAFWAIQMARSIEDSN